jgi:hypothetical protein
MSKEYFCKDCEHNNNGWCPIKKMNGLKKIINCKDKKVGGYLSKSGQEEYNEVVDNLYKDIDYTPYKNYGKREMFFRIQQQLEAMDNNLTVKDVKQLMVNLEKMLQINEQIQGIETEYELEQDVIKSSKFISAKWFNEVGEYKGK